MAARVDARAHARPRAVFTPPASTRLSLPRCLCWCPIGWHLTSCLRASGHFLLLRRETEAKPSFADDRGASQPFILLRNPTANVANELICPGTNPPSTRSLSLRGRVEGPIVKHHPPPRVCPVLVSPPPFLQQATKSRDGNAINRRLTFNFTQSTMLFTNTVAIRWTISPASLLGRETPRQQCPKWCRCAS